MVQELSVINVYMNHSILISKLPDKDILCSGRVCALLPHNSYNISYLQYRNVDRCKLDNDDLSFFHRHQTLKSRKKKKRNIEF